MCNREFFYEIREFVERSRELTNSEARAPGERQPARSGCWRPRCRNSRGWCQTSTFVEFGSTQSAHFSQVGAAVDWALDRSALAQGEFCTSWFWLDCRRDTRIRSGTTISMPPETVARGRRSSIFAEEQRCPQVCFIGA
jgi:hypothetical protein